MVFALDKTLSFPDPHLGEPDGLLAVGQQHAETCR